MELTPQLVTVIGLAIALAAFTGGWAARVILRAAETRRDIDTGGAPERDLRP